MHYKIITQTHKSIITRIKVYTLNLQLTLLCCESLFACQNFRNDDVGMNVIIIIKERYKKRFAPNTFMALIKKACNMYVVFYVC